MLIFARDLHRVTPIPGKRTDLSMSPKLLIVNNTTPATIVARKERIVRQGRRIEIQLSDGSTIVAKVEYSSGDNITVKGANGFIYQVDRNMRNDDGAYVTI